MDHGHRRRSDGQTLVEFALVLPVLVAIIGGIIQFGLIFWSQVTLTQVVRDTGRWASTQQYSGTVGSDNCTSEANTAAVVTTADTIAKSSSLLAYSGQWLSGGAGESVSVGWSDATQPSTAGDTCPPPDNGQVWNITITAQHTIPVFFPGLQFLPGFAGNQVTLFSEAVFRMEPQT